MHHVLFYGRLSTSALQVVRGIPLQQYSVELATCQAAENATTLSEQVISFYTLSCAFLTTI